MSLKNRLNKIESNQTKVIELITYTVLAKEDNRLEFEVKKEQEGKEEIITLEQYNEEYKRNEEDVTKELKLYIDHLSVEQLRVLAEVE